MDTKNGFIICRWLSDIDNIYAITYSVNGGTPQTINRKGWGAIAYRPKRAGDGLTVSVVVLKDTGASRPIIRSEASLPATVTATVGYADGGYFYYEDKSIWRPW